MHGYRAKAVLLLLAGALVLGLLSLPWAIGPGSSEAQQGAMHNCPQAGKWAISVWDGADGTDTSEALATCGEGAVDFAYYIDPDTQAWLRYFAARTDISNLLTLNNMQGVLAYGAAALSTLGHIAFASNREGQYEIYLMNADGSGQARLTDNPASDYSPAWSLDDSRIAFVSYRDGNSEIYVMNADGSGQACLTDNPALDHSPAWSPDGSRMAFVSDRDGNSEIYVMNADGSGQTRLTDDPAHDSGPDWSPDGSNILFHRLRDFNGEVHVMNADGSEQTNLTNNPANEDTPAWSPDGSRIAFQSNRDGNLEIYVMNADGSGQTNLTNSPAFDVHPTWSRDGFRIAFVSDRDGNSEIYVMNADGSGHIRLTNNDWADEAPAWSADGIGAASAVSLAIAQAPQGAMHNCPQAGKWAISVWDGADGTDTSEALATCGQGAVDFAYYIDPDTQTWLRYFAGRADISNLLTLNTMQGVLVYGAAPTPTPTPTATATPVNGEVTITGELVGIFSYWFLSVPGIGSSMEMDYWPAIEDETGKFTMLRAPGMVLHPNYPDEGAGYSLTMTIAGYTYTHSPPFKDERIRRNVWLGRTGNRVRVTGVLEVGAVTPLMDVAQPIKADVIHVTSIEEVP